MDWTQLFIAIFGVSAIWFVNEPKAKIARWGPVFGLISQPFWFYMAWAQGDWGILILCFFYTWGWGKGFWKFWVKKEGR